MTRSFKGVLLAGALCAAFSAPAASAHPHNVADRVQARVERMKEHLGLSDEQATQIRDLLLQAAEQEQANRERMREQRRAVHDKIQALLTDEQKAKRDELRKEHLRERHGRHERRLEHP